MDRSFCIDRLLKKESACAILHISIIERLFYMKFLVTGGAGFIGTNFIRYLLSQDDVEHIVCLDKLTYAGNYDNLRIFENTPRFSFVQMDICDREKIFSLFAECHFDYVIHFAAESHVDRSIENPSLFLQTNVIGTSVLLDAALKYGIKRFHQISTDEVYGDLPLDRPDLLFYETSPLKPSSPYSASKASADLLALSYHRTYGLPITVSRCSNNYGPYQFPEKLIPLMITKASKNLPLPVYGDGKNVRDWIYVEDHCTAVYEIIRHGKDGEIYHIGGNEEKENLEIVRLILEKLQKPQNLITFVPDRKGHDRRYGISSEKLQKELGWKPKTDFVSGMEKTITWYQNNTEWLRRIETGAYRLQY